MDLWLTGISEVEIRSIILTSASLRWNFCLTFWSYMKGIIK